jgi:hypothetical protein
VVVEHGVHERGAQQRSAVLVAGLVRRCRSVLVALPAAGVAPPAAVGDVAQLLDVDVQQRAGGVVLVAADRLTAGAVDVGEPVDPAAAQDRVHRGGRQTEPIGDGHRPQPLFPPQVHDPAHDRLWGAPRAVVRPAGPIGHAGLPGGAVAVGPPLGRGPGDVEHRRRVADRPAGLDHRASELEAVAWGQGGISVGHEDLRVV